MAKLIIQKKDKDLFESVTEWENNIYSVRFKNYDDAIWCKSLSDVYLALDQFKRTGRVNTNEYSEVVA